MGQEPDQIRQEIEATRLRLGETVEALAYKTDVPARAQDALAEKALALQTMVVDVADQGASAAADLSERVRSGEVSQRAASFANANPLAIVISLFALLVIAGTIVARRRS